MVTLHVIRSRGWRAARSKAGGGTGGPSGVVRLARGGSVGGATGAVVGARRRLLPARKGRGLERSAEGASEGQGGGGRRDPVRADRGEGQSPSPSIKPRQGAAKE